MVPVHDSMTRYLSIYYVLLCIYKHHNANRWFKYVQITFLSLIYIYIYDIYIYIYRYIYISIFNDTASISRHGSVHQSCEQAVIAAEIRFVDGCDKANDIAYCH